MNPSICLRCRLHELLPRSLGRQFHTSSPRLGRRRPVFKSIKASDLDLLEKRAANFPKYNQTDEGKLSKAYTREQIKAIKAAEQSIDPRDLAAQGRPRDDTNSLSYLSDLSEIDPILDRPRKGPARQPPSGRPIPKSEEEIATAINEFVARVDSQQAVQSAKDIKDSTDIEVELQKFINDPENLFSGENVKLFESTPVGAAALPKKLDDSAQSSRENMDDPRLRRLKLDTGLSKDDFRNIKLTVLVVRGVSNQTTMGKIRSQYVLTIAGNGKGMVGLGEGKGAEFSDAKMQADNAAIRNMKPIPRYEQRTIYGTVRGKVSAVELELQHRPPGFGLRCQYLIFEICRLAGISDLSGKVLRSRNKMNVCKATIAALHSQKIPDDIARARGRKLVDVRKVYYGGRSL